MTAAFTVAVSGDHSDIGNGEAGLWTPLRKMNAYASGII
jgi:hypothetical protein